MEGCNQSFPRCNNLELGMHVEENRCYRKQRTIHNVANHLFVQPTAYSDPGSLCVGMSTTRGGGYSQIRSEITSDQ